MFAEALHELVSAEYSVNIDEIGEFKSVPLFPNRLNYNNNLALAEAAKRNIVSFNLVINLLDMWLKDGGN